LGTHKGKTNPKDQVPRTPDIDAEVFKRDIASQIVPATLYASSRDQALTLSKTFHGYPRAGDAGHGLMIVSGIETVDATSVATDFVGHSYFAESRSIIGDIFYLIRDGKRARDRFGLQEIDAPTGRYWVFRP
jgi:esterase/lipase superfamily enzyme